MSDREEGNAIIRPSLRSILIQGGVDSDIDASGDGGGGVDGGAGVCVVGDDGVGGAAVLDVFGRVHGTLHNDRVGPDPGPRGTRPKCISACV